MREPSRRVATLAESILARIEVQSSIIYDYRSSYQARFRLLDPFSRLCAGHCCPIVS
jgi:hypothetical protein